MSTEAKKKYSDWLFEKMISSRFASGALAEVICYVTSYSSIFPKVDTISSHELMNRVIFDKASDEEIIDLSMLTNDEMVGFLDKILTKLAEEGYKLEDSKSVEAYLGGSHDMFVYKLLVGATVFRIPLKIYSIAQ